MARFRRIFDGGVEANRKCAAHPNSAARSGKKRLSTTAPLFKSPTHHQKAFTIARICMSCVRVCVSLCVCVCGASRFPGTSWASVSDEEGFSFSTSTSMEIVLIDFIVGLFQRPAATTWHAHDSRKSRREFPSYKKNPTYSITNPENKTNTIKIQSLLKRKLATQRKSNSRSEWTELPLINHCKSKETNEKRKKIYLKTTRVQVDCQTESRFIGYGNETKQEAYVGKSNEYHYTWSITGSRRLCGNRRDPWKFVSKRNHRIMNADQVCLVSYEGVQWVRLSEPGASVAIVFVAAAAAAAAAVVVVFSLQPLLLLLLLLLAWAEEKKRRRRRWRWGEQIIRNRGRGQGERVDNKNVEKWKRLASAAEEAENKKRRVDGAEVREEAQGKSTENDRPEEEQSTARDDQQRQHRPRVPIFRQFPLVSWQVRASGPVWPPHAGHLRPCPPIRLALPARTLVAREIWTWERRDETKKKTPSSAQFRIFGRLLDATTWKVSPIFFY